MHVASALKPAARGRIMGFLRQHPGADARAIDAWLASEDNQLACQRCEVPLLTWEALNQAIYCQSCDEALHPRRVLSHDEERQEALVTEAAAMGIEPVYQALDVDGWRGRMPAEFATFVNRPEGFWYVHGPQGRGKTHLTVAAARAIRRATNPPTWVMWRDVPILLEHLKANLHKAADETRLLGRCRLLVLDDLGAERGTDYEQTTVGGVLRARHLAAVPTIVTGNLTPDELHEIEPRLASRLCSGLITGLGGPDKRLTGRRAS